MVVEQKYGVVIFAGDNICPKPFSAVKGAAISAGIDEALVHEIKPRSTFIRAMHKLEKEGVIQAGSDGVLRDKIRDDVDHLDFCFSKRYLQELGVNYDAAAMIRFSKKSHLINCENEQIKAVALKLYDALQGTYQITDIHSLVKRVVENAGLKQILLRAGVYFIPYQGQVTVEKITAFYSALSFSFFTLPVGTSSGQQQNIVKSIVEDIKKTVVAYCQEIENLKKTEGLTKKIAQNRIKDLKKELKHYKILAESVSTDLDEILTQAGNAGAVIKTLGADNTEVLIARIGSSQKLSQEMVDLLEVSETLPVEALNLAKSKIGTVDLANSDNTEYSAQDLPLWQKPQAPVDVMPV